MKHENSKQPKVLQEAVIHERCKLSKGTKCLDLSGIRLKSIPRCVLCLGATLRHLYMHNCSLSGDFPFALSQHLETLDLAQNSISVLPEAFCMTAVRLTILDLSYNNLTRIPGSIGELSSLRELNLAHNQIIYLPSELGSLCHLEELDVNSNCVLGLTDNMFQSGACHSLKKLDLSSNHLTELPETIGNVRSLISLNLSNNKLKYLPASCGRLSLIEVFLYGGNMWYEKVYNSSAGRAYGTKALIVIAALSL